MTWSQSHVTFFSLSLMQIQARAFVPCKPFPPGACAIKRFTAIIVAVGEQARKYVTAIHFQPRLIFACNGRQNNLVITMWQQLQLLV